MATITSTKVSINGAPYTTLSGFAGQETASLTLDLMGSTYNSSFKACNSTWQIPLLNEISVQVVDSNQVANTKEVYVAREIHKQMFCTQTLLTITKTLNMTSTLRNYLGLANGAIDVSMWSPFKKVGAAAWDESALTLTQMNLLCKIRGNINVGLQIDYMNGVTPTTKYIDAGGTADSIDWTLPAGSTTSTRRVMCSDVQTLIDSSYTQSVTVKDGRVFVAPSIIPDSVLDTMVISLFNIPWLSFASASNFTITPFLYTGSKIGVGAGATTTKPTSYSPISIDSTSYLKKVSTRADGNALSTIAITNTDNSINPGLSVDTDVYGWVGNYNSSSTDDTSITIGVSVQDQGSGI